MKGPSTSYRWRSEPQIALDVILRADVVDPHDGHDLLELLANLFQHAVVAHDDKGHAREGGILGFADGEAVDVVAARGKHTGNMGQHAGDVLDESGKDVTHTGVSDGHGSP